MAGRGLDCQPTTPPAGAGGLSESKGAVCKTVGTADDGSNPSPATTCEDAPRPADTAVRRTPGNRGPLSPAFPWSPAWAQIARTHDGPASGCQAGRAVPDGGSRRGRQPAMWRPGGPVRRPPPAGRSGTRRLGARATGPATSAVHGGLGAPACAPASPSMLSRSAATGPAGGRAGAPGPAMSRHDRRCGPGRPQRDSPPLPPAATTSPPAIHAGRRQTPSASVILGIRPHDAHDSMQRNRPDTVRHRARVRCLTEPTRTCR
jgi:hypothetical protein